MKQTFPSRVELLEPFHTDRADLQDLARFTLNRTAAQAVNQVDCGVHGLRAYD